MRYYIKVLSVNDEEFIFNNVITLILNDENLQLWYDIESDVPTVVIDVINIKNIKVKCFKKEIENGRHNI